MGLGRAISIVLFAVLLALAACGGPRQLPSRQAPVTAEGSPGKPRVMVVTRPVNKLVVLSLFVDAGSRDATPVESAALAASVMAEAAGSDAMGVAYPDGIEITLPCDKEQLTACVTRLGRSLRLRKVTDAQLRSARIALARGTARQLTDDRTSVLSLALRDAVGATLAKALSPLPASEALKSITTQDVERFLAAHMGPTRALLIGSGAVRIATLTDAVEEALNDLPRATSARNSRTLTPEREERSRGLVGQGPRHALGLTWLTAQPTHAEARCRLFKQHLLREAAPVEVDECATLPLRGGAFAMLSVSSRNLGKLLAAVAQAERLNSTELNSNTVHPRQDAPLEEENRRLGLAFAAGEALSEFSRLGVGLLSPRPLEKAQEQLTQARAISQVPDLGPVGDAQEAQAVVDTPLGTAHLHVRRRESPLATIVIGRSPGAAEDPAAAHGRAALLTTLSAIHCDGLSEAALSAQLERLSATLRPQLSARRWGLSLTLPAAHLDAGVDLALRCALHPSLSRAHISDARLTLRAQLHHLPANTADYRDSLAHHLLPRAPGEIARIGSTDELARVSEESIARPLARRRELSVALVGPVSADAIVGRIAQALASRTLGDARLAAAQTADEGPRTGGSAGSPVAQTSFSDPVPALIVLRFNSDRTGGAAGAKAASLRLRTALSSLLGLPSTVNLDGELPGGGYAAVGLKLQSPLPEGFSARLSKALKALGDPRADVEALNAQASLHWDGMTATSEGEARVLAGFGRDVARPSLEAALAMAKGLLEADPQLWPVSP